MLREEAKGAVVRLLRAAAVAAAVVLAAVGATMAAAGASAGAAPGLPQAHAAVLASMTKLPTYSVLPLMLGRASLLWTRAIGPELLRWLKMTLDLCQLRQGTWTWRCPLQRLQEPTRDPTHLQFPEMSNVCVVSELREARLKLCSGGSPLSRGAEWV